MTTNLRIALIVLILALQSHSVENKLARRNAAWANLHAGRTLTEGIHGALDFNFKFDTNMYGLQFQVFQVCVPNGCVSRPHSSYNFMYGKAYSINHYTHYYFQAGVSAVQLRKSCKSILVGYDGLANPIYTVTCNEGLEGGIPMRAGIMAGNFIGVSFELTGLITPSYQIVGAQVGMPLGVF